MSQEPYASAKRVFWIVDNGSSHRGRMAADRLTVVFPNTVNCGLNRPVRSMLTPLGTSGAAFRTCVP